MGEGEWRGMAGGVREGREKREGRREGLRGAIGFDLLRFQAHMDFNWASLLTKVVVYNVTASENRCVN